MDLNQLAPEDVQEAVDLTPVADFGPFSSQELALDAILMSVVIPDLPGDEPVFVGFKPDGSDDITLVSDDEDTPLDVGPGADLTSQLRNMDVDSLVFFIPSEGTETVEDIVQTLKDELTGEVCGKL